jgi:hypothetical protein
MRISLFILTLPLLSSAVMDKMIIHYTSETEAMASLPKIQLDCWKDPKGYHLAKTVPPNLLRVVRNGRTDDKLELCRPLDDSSALFRIFATKATTPEGVLNFVHHFGPLRPNGNNEGELVGDVIQRALMMQNSLKWLSEQPKRRRPRKEIDLNLHISFHLHVSLDWDPATNNPEWQFRPASLLDALWLQFGQAVTRGVHIRSCAHCGDLFETGLGTGRRLDAKFCSDEHRIAFNSLKRSKEK